MSKYTKLNLKRDPRCFRVISNNKSSIKFLYAVMLVVFTVASLCHLRIVVVKYRNHETTTTIHYLKPVAGETRFPWVTICNNNPIKFNHENVSKIIDSSDVAQLNKSSTIVNLTNTDVQMTVIKILSKLNLADKVATTELFNDKGETILGCRYGFFECSPRNFTEWFHPRFGQCFTWAEDLSAVASQDMGLYVQLFVNTQSYMPEVAKSTGFHIQIHEPNTVPFPESEGFALRPGTMTAAKVKRTLIQRLPAPYSTCSDNITVPDVTFYDGIKFKYKYSDTICQKNCQIKDVLESCGCIDPRSANSRGQEENLMNVCGSASGDTRLHKLQCLMETATKSHQNCNCELACWSWKYHIHRAVSSWPSDVAVRQFLPNWRSKNNALKPMSDPDVIRQEVASVLVYFQDLSYGFVNEEAAVTFWTVISEVGGSIDLFLGLSAVAVLEFFHTWNEKLSAWKNRTK